MPWIEKQGRTVEEARQAAVTASGLPEAELEVEVLTEGAKGLFGLGGEPAVVRVRPRSEAADVRAAFQDDITPGGDEITRNAARPPRETVVEVPSGEPGARGDDERAPERAAAAIAEQPSDESKLSLTEQQEEASRIGAEIVTGILERMGLAGEVNARVSGGTVYIEVFGDDMGILIGRSGATLEALQEIVRAGVQRKLRTRQAVVVDVEAYWERRRKNRGRREEGGRRGGNGRRRGPRRNGNR